MNKISPLGALAALIVIGVSIELVEQQDKTAAYALVFLIILGMITFNAGAFRAQMATLIALLNQRPNAGGGAKFG